MTKREYYQYCGVYSKWHNKTLSQFDNDPRAKKKVKKYLAKVELALHRGVGIFLYGDNGTGKSHLLNTAFMELIEKRYTVKILQLSQLVSMYADAWYSDDASDEFDILLKTQFLGIEEIGKEFRAKIRDADSKNQDLTITVLDNVIRHRLQNSLPTWFTSNLAPSAIKTKYSEDIFSMLKEHAIPLLVKGVDYRDLVKVDFTDED